MNYIYRTIELFTILPSSMSMSELFFYYLPFALILVAIFCKKISTVNTLVAITGIYMLIIGIYMYNSAIPESILSSSNSHASLGMVIVLSMHKDYNTLISFLMLLTLIFKGIRLKKISNKYTILNFILIGIVFLIPFMLEPLIKYVWDHRNLG